MQHASFRGGEIHGERRLGSVKSALSANFNKFIDEHPILLEFFKSNIINQASAGVAR